MKIIVTGSPTVGAMHAQYEADRWSVNPEGYLHIFNKDNTVVGMHAPGMWAHVRGYAENQ